MPLPLLAVLLAIASWTPPADPNPSAIRKEAGEDARAGRYGDALAKRVWYHENALQLRQSLYGVRLSFALSEWKELADEYPPALDAMRAARDRAESQLVAGEDSFHAFHDFKALNEQLGESQRTLERFLKLREEAPAVAKKCYRVAEPLLVAAEQYAICGEYLAPGVTVQAALSGHEIEVRLAKERPSAGFDYSRQRRADERLSKQVATLLALLVLNDREDEAAEIVELVRPKLTKKIDLRRIDAGLEGVPPEPL